MTSTPVPASPIDGQWRGSGLLENRSGLIISFKVESGRVTGITYQFEGPEKKPCFNTHYFIIPKDRQSQVTADGFSAKLGRDMDVTAKFTSPDSASGHLSADIFYRFKTCNRKFEVDRTAEKQQSVQVVEAQQPARKNPFEIFFQIFIFGLSNGAALALNAIGVTIIYGTVRALNLAHEMCSRWLRCSSLHWLI